MEATKTYHIYFDQSLDAVVMEWEGYATSVQFKEGTELMLNTLIKHGAKKVLADIRDMVLIGKEDQEWLDKQFLPRAFKFGFQALAIIRPDHYFNKVAVETISYKIDQSKLAIQFFDNESDAKKWLAGLNDAS
jgi:hypothetical protein